MSSAPYASTFQARKVQDNRPTQNIDCETLKIPKDCLCTWVVIRVCSGAVPALSRLKYPHGMCWRHRTGVGL